MVHPRVLILNQFSLTHSSRVAEYHFPSYNMLSRSFDPLNPWYGLPRAKLLPEQIIENTYKGAFSSGHIVGNSIRVILGSPPSLKGLHI